jgi:hypothetical protein
MKYRVSPIGFKNTLSVVAANVNAIESPMLLANNFVTMLYLNLDGSAGGPAIEVIAVKMTSKPISSADMYERILKPPKINS